MRDTGGNSPGVEWPLPSLDRLEGGLRVKVPALTSSVSPTFTMERMRTQPKQQDPGAKPVDIFEHTGRPAFQIQPARQT